MQSRCIEEDENRLYSYASTLVSAGEKELKVPQKGGRKAQSVRLDIKYAPVTLKSPANKKQLNDIPLYCVGCIEKGGNDEKLAWHLLTFEPVTNKEEALKIVSYYEQRWLIEDFHKVWKSEGTQVEQLRMQSKDNLERLSVILAFIATRLLQLRFMNESETLSKTSCESVLKGKVWKLMWLKVEGKKLPSETPDISWAYRGIARLGGWKDTKRTGRASIKSLWQGWLRLQTILEGYELSKSLD